MVNKQTANKATEKAWAAPRFTGVERTYTAEDVYKIRDSVHVEHSLARLGAEKLWSALHTEHHINALGALTGNQGVQMAQAGLKAIYLSGWQIAADATTCSQMCPDQSLYPVNSVPQVVKAIDNALLLVSTAISSGETSTNAMASSAEEEQFEHEPALTH